MIMAHGKKFPGSLEIAGEKLPPVNAPMLIQDLQCPGQVVCAFFEILLCHIEFTCNIIIITFFRNQTDCLVINFHHGLLIILFI